MECLVVNFQSTLNEDNAIAFQSLHIQFLLHESEIASVSN